MCRAFAEALVEEERHLGVSVQIPGELPVEVGVVGGRRFPFADGSGALTLCSRPPADEGDGQALAELLELVLALDSREESSRDERAQRVRTLVHDIRSLLAVMMGHCEILESGLGGDLNPRQLKSVSSIRRQVERCEALLTERRAGLVDHETAS